MHSEHHHLYTDSTSSLQTVEMSDNRVWCDSEMHELLISVGFDALNDSLDDALCQFQEVDQTPGSNAFFDPTLFEQPQPGNIPPLSPPKLTQPFERGMNFEDSTETQQGLGAFSDEHVSELDQYVCISEDQFFQYFQQLAAQQGQCVPARSRFFPNADEVFSTAPGVQSACEYLEYSDEPCELALSDGEHGGMDRHKGKAGRRKAATRKLPVSNARFPQHLPGGTFDCFDSRGAPYS